MPKYDANIGPFWRVMEARLKESRGEARITVVFAQKRRFSCEVAIHNGEPRVVMGEDTRALFQTVPRDLIRSRLLVTSVVPVESAWKDLQNLASVSLNAAAVGLFGPLNSGERTSHSYSANREFSILAGTLRQIFPELGERLPDNEQFLSLRECAATFRDAGLLEPTQFPVTRQGTEVDGDEYFDDDTFTIQDILDEGCFLPEEHIGKLLDRVRSKKNLILQGPPGTGKTWLARRLGYALVGERDEAKVKSVQFHPNLSYEDFVRGYRPSGEGKLVTADGIFMNMVNTAIADPDSAYVLIIEEINRGNPAQIFGELLTLLEDSKRDESEAIELTYPGPNGERRVYIPENLHVIGTMNIADRSLALVDLALRRRFAFADLQPELGPAWKEWVQKDGLPEDIVDEIARRMSDLNQMISDDSRLGKQFRVGHSYVTPVKELTEDGWAWFQDVIEHEIAPLLEEYWFDSPKDFKVAVERLKQPF